MHMGMVNGISSIHVHSIKYDARSELVCIMIGCGDSDVLRCPHWVMSTHARVDRDAVTDIDAGLVVTAGSLPRARQSAVASRVAPFHQRALAILAKTRTNVCVHVLHAQQPCLHRTNDLETTVHALSIEPRRMVRCELIGDTVDAWDRSLLEALSRRCHANS